jgi:murein L,D-transpeptidase YcbB/YkuD
MKTITGAVMGAALLLAAPAIAAAPSAISAGSLAPAVAVDRFSAERGGEPIWLREGVDGPAVTQLLTALRQAPLDGFAKGPQLADAAEQLLVRARSGDRAAAREADRLLSSAWVLYVQALHWPTSGMIYADSSLAPRIPSPTDVLAGLASAPSLERHVVEVSRVNTTYAELRAAAAITIDSELKGRILANMDRARALPSGGRYVLVDLASQRLWMMDGGQPVDSMRVVVGKAEMPTPLLAGTIRQATFNPYWNVPIDLARHNIAPAVMKGGAAYLAAKGYEVLSGWDAEARPLAPGSVDWEAVAQGKTEVRVRQRPGQGNMMGAMKFEFPNRNGIYLHDTPDKSLFRLGSRTASSGCVRLEDAARLGRWLLGREPVASGDAPEQQVALPAPVPVYITYLTVRPEGGELKMAEDIYGLDRVAAVKMAAR